MPVTTLAIAAAMFAVGWWFAARRSQHRLEDEEDLWRARVDAMRLDLTIAEAKLRHAYGRNHPLRHSPAPERSPRPTREEMPTH